MLVLVSQIADIPNNKWNRSASVSSAFMLAGRLSSLSTFVNPVSLNQSEAAYNIGGQLFR